MANIGSRLSTDAQFISDLMSGINKGEVKIPQFQRKFVWDEEQALKLLDSISQNYPIGSLLLWKTKDKLAVERNIGEFQLPKTDDITPTDYVLDGQQRLTVIYSCFGAAPSSGGFEAGYDLESEKFVRTEGSYSPSVIPLRSVYRTTDLLNFRTSLVGHPRAAELQPRLDALVESITKYKLPVVTLKDLTVEEVCPIFERINSTGTRLSTFDLMVAATWSTTFDLNAAAEEIARALTPKGFGDIDPNTVLKCLSAIQHRDVKRETIISLRKLPKSEMDALVAKAKRALLSTVDLLKTEFGIFSWDFLPYEALVTILSVVFADKKSLAVEQVKRVRKWFWQSGFTERYRGASEHFISRDISSIEDFITSGKAPSAPFDPVPSVKSIASTQFRSNNSKSRAFILLLAKAAPHNLTNGAAIDVDTALSSFNKKQFHHIYPKSYLRGSEEGSDENCLPNICMLSAAENNAVSDSDPKEYIPAALTSHGKESEKVLRSNVMPIGFNYATKKFGDFVDARSALLHARIEELCRGDA